MIELCRYSVAVFVVSTDAAAAAADADAVAA